MSQDLFQDAQQLEDLLTHEEDPTAWREWSLLSSEGDLAALLELVSENKVSACHFQPMSEPNWCLRLISRSTRPDHRQHAQL